MQTVTNIPQDYTLTRYFAKFYSLYSVKSLPTAVTCNSRLRSVLNIVNRKAGVPLLQGASDSFVLPVPKPAVKGRIFVAFSSGTGRLRTDACLCQRRKQEPTEREASRREHRTGKRLPVP